MPRIDPKVLKRQLALTERDSEVLGDRPDLSYRRFRPERLDRDVVLGKFCGAFEPGFPGFHFLASQFDAAGIFVVAKLMNLRGLTLPGHAPGTFQHEAHAVQQHTAELSLQG